VAGGLWRVARWRVISYFISAEEVP